MTKEAELGEGTKKGVCAKNGRTGEVSELLKSVYWTMRGFHPPFRQNEVGLAIRGYLSLFSRLVPLIYNIDPNSGPHSGLRSKRSHVIDIAVYPWQYLRV